MMQRYTLRQGKLREDNNGAWVKHEAAATHGTWRPASEPPSIPVGDLISVIVAKLAGLNQAEVVYGAWYLREFSSVDTRCQNESEIDLTGFADRDCYDDVFELIDVDFWMPTPAGPRN